MSLGVSLESLAADHHGSDSGSVSLPYMPFLHAAGRQALRLPEEAVEAVEVWWPLWQKVIVGVTDFTSITDDGEDTGALAGGVFPLRLGLDHFGCSIFRI